MNISSYDDQDQFFNKSLVLILMTANKNQQTRNQEIKYFMTRQLITNSKLSYFIKIKEIFKVQSKQHKFFFASIITSKMIKTV